MHGIRCGEYPAQEARAVYKPRSAGGGGTGARAATGVHGDQAALSGGREGFAQGSRRRGEAFGREVLLGVGNAAEDGEDQDGNRNSRRVSVMGLGTWASVP